MPIGPEERHRRQCRSNDGGTWSASELFTNDRLGFGTYQWQVEGPIDTYDKNVVLGLFPYGPQANIGSDGTNEIDIEYSRWGQANGANGDFTDYPATGSTIGEQSFTFSLTGLTSTSRFVWSSTHITDFLFDGLEPLASSADPLKTWNYAPAEPTTNVPQMALPLGMNLWCFEAPPSDGNPVEIVIHSFEFVAEGAAGAGGAPGGGAGMANLGGNPGGTAGAVNAGGSLSGASAGEVAGAAAGALNVGGRSSAGSGAGAQSAGGAGNAGHGGVAGEADAAGRGGTSGTPGADGGGGIGGAPASGGALSNAGASASAGSAHAPSSSAGCSCSHAKAASSRACSGVALLLAAWLARRLRRTFPLSPGLGARNFIRN